MAQQVLSALQMPWLRSAYGTLAQSVAANRLPAAVLLTGVAGIGKRTLADDLASLLICVQPQPTELGHLRACGQCKSCQLKDAGNHPDYLFLTANDKGTITVDAIRELTRVTAQATHQSGRRVIVIVGAEAMNSNAANALLKTLEEPPAGTFIIMTTAVSSRLLPTIISRCQHYPLSASPEQATDWLQQHQLNVDFNVLTLLQNAPLALQNFIQSEEYSQLQAFSALYARWQQGEKGALNELKELIAQAPVERINWLINWVSAEAKQAPSPLASQLSQFYRNLLNSRVVLSQSGINQVLQVEKVISYGVLVNRE
ncbi:hypothetical protein DU002_00955 [Corallincola holothuriorum]|uniref:DNA-directed DNA polymerase n=1 Tax=Corallincola holothuriorum TaxID=2282215 RepID=A0A368NTM9_9GAMM|nr:DNA polymerase III subunit delta' [Corallincola holothuriorum]RCU52571.1 hypothetical protein DU002_00955 [Corallincola holothuriorum]